MRDSKSNANQSAHSKYNNVNATKSFHSSQFDDADLKYIEFIKSEKNIDNECMQKNLEKINTCRFYLAILSGVFSGTFTLTGLSGVFFYFFIFLLFSILLFGYLQLEKGNHFTSKVQPITHGLFTNIMVHLIFWVMFYNLVNIY